VGRIRKAWESQRIIKEGDDIPPRQRFHDMPLNLQAVQGEAVPLSR